MDNIFINKNNVNYTMVTTVSNASDSTERSFKETVESLADHQVSLVIWRYCPFFLLPLGTIGNLLLIWVLSLQGDRSVSAPVFFKALAVSDLCLLYTGLLRNWIKYFFHVEIRDVHTVVCKIHIWVVYVTGMTSAWFLVAMTAQRALFVVWPHRMEGIRTRKSAWVTVVVIVVISGLVNARVLYGYDLKVNKNDGLCHCDYINEEYEAFARDSGPWIDLTLTCLLPFILLIGSNVLLMRRVASSVRYIKELSKRGSAANDVVSQRKKMSTSLNFTLICLSAIFLLLTSPVNVYLVMDHYLQDDLNINAELRAKMNLAWAVTNNLWYAHSAITFYLYCLSGSRFRQQVRQCFWRLKLASAPKSCQIVRQVNVTSH